jgi:two-component system, chemotaxis family, sensor kinase CheA
VNPSERLLKQFRDLVTVRLERINRSLMELESGGNLEAGQRVLRELHGLKGEARMMGFDEINTLVHQMEELVRSVEPHRYRLSGESTDALLATADTVLALSGALQAGEPPLAVETLVATLQQRVVAEAARPPMDEKVERAPPHAAHLLVAARTEPPGAPVVPAHWGGASRLDASPGAPSAPAAAQFLTGALRPESGAPSSSRLVDASGVPGAPSGSRLVDPSASPGAPSGSRLMEPSASPGVPLGSRLVDPGVSLGALSGSRLVEPGAAPGAPSGSRLVEPGASPGVLLGSRYVDASSMSGAPTVSRLADSSAAPGTSAGSRLVDFSAVPSAQPSSSLVDPSAVQGTQPGSRLVDPSAVPGVQSGSRLVDPSAVQGAQSGSRLVDTSAMPGVSPGSRLVDSSAAQGSPMGSRYYVDPSALSGTPPSPRYVDPTGTPGTPPNPRFVDPNVTTGVPPGSRFVDSSAAPGAPTGSRLVDSGVAQGPLPGTRMVDSGPRSRPSSGPGQKAGAGVGRSGDVRVDTSVRIGVASLDMLTSAVTNLGQVARRRELANARRLELVRELSELARAAEDLGPAGLALAERLGRAKELAATLHREAKLLANAELRDLGQVSEEVQGLRMLPLSVLFEPYPRMVRDLARELGKEVELVVDGEDTRADRAVVEALREPLMHLVRNALDHGLETRVDRVAAGKHPRGCLTLRAAREGSRIVLRVEDDGAGMDPGLLRRVAVRRGILDETAANALSDAAARDLVFLPGFTSREVVTDLSGRGVGLDAVRTSLQALGGDVGVESAPGWGTIFTLRVPVSLTVAPLLFVQVDQETLALSAVHVSRALKVDASDISELAGRPTLRMEGRVLPFASLASLLGLGPERPAKEGELVLVVKGQGLEAALAVDRVLEERVQAILPLKGILARFTHLTGATSLADGRLAMVLSAAALAAGVHGTAPLRLARPSPRAPEPRRRRILVVDDSPLTRELVANLLEAVGYDTSRAADGPSALELLSQEDVPVELVVTDLEMPEMDGVELTRRLKTDPARGGLPVVILTTRGGEADRARGLAAGADGYITKGDLVRQDLVDVVGRLLG